MSRDVERAAEHAQLPQRELELAGVERLARPDFRARRSYERGGGNGRNVGERDEGDGGDEDGGERSKRPASEADGRNEHRPRILLACRRTVEIVEDRLRVTIGGIDAQDGLG